MRRCTPPTRGSRPRKALSDAPVRQPQAIPGEVLPDHPEVLWRDPDPKPSCDVIVGGGGHGLATANYRAKNHGITDIAVLEVRVAAEAGTVAQAAAVRTRPAATAARREWRCVSTPLRQGPSAGGNPSLNRRYATPGRSACAAR